jgi:hypothetical protein
MRPDALALSLTLTLLCTAACQKPTPTGEGQGAAQGAAVSPSPSAPGVIDGETYQVFLPTTPGAAVRVLAKPGFKPNADYPHRLTLKGPSPNPEVSGEIGGVISGEALTFAAAPASGAQVAASADFSICNDQMCKLYRAVELSWVAP